MARSKQSSGPQVLAGFNLGYNGYANPTTLGPRQWAGATNVYSGQHGNIRRARFAPVVNGNTTGFSFSAPAVFDSLYNFRDPQPEDLLLGDVQNKLWTFDIFNNYKATQRVNPMVDPSGTGVAAMAGPWSRFSILNMVFEMNGQTKQTGRSTGALTVEDWGIDLPDASPAVTLSAGSITKTIGRSYAYAWENANKINVCAISPVTQYFAMSSQQASIQCIEPGTVASSGSTVTGIGTSFTSAWIGKYIWIVGSTTNGTAAQRITAVASATSLTIAGTLTIGAGASFIVVDPQVTHIRLYATADGGATYYRIQRNAFVPTASTISAAGLQFTDTDNSEPPNGEFASTEIAQLYNVPPPVGQFIYEYQSRGIIWGVSGALQTLFYTNIELTTVGSPPENCAPLNQITFPIGDGQLQCVAGLPTGLVVWSDRHDMFKVTGLLSDNSAATAVQQGATVIQRLPYNLGAASPFAFAVTPLGVVWLTSDKEVYLFTDNYAPRNVGRPVQDLLNGINPNQLANARMAYVHTADRNWVALAIPTGNTNANNMLLILDLDMLASNGSPSFFVFDMATNQPSWYVFNTVCNAIVGTFDQAKFVHLLVADGNQITDVTYQTGFFTIGQEMPVTGSVTLHALGNDSAEMIKRLEWLRFITNQSPDSLNAQGWTFEIQAIDDDHYTFTNPYLLNLTPGVDSPLLGNVAAQPPGATGVTVWPGVVSSLANEFSSCLFITKGVKSLVGRRFRIVVNFPASAGDWEWRSVEYNMTPVSAR